LICEQSGADEVDAEYQKLTLNLEHTPTFVFGGNMADKLPRFLCDLRSGSAPGNPSPSQRCQIAMPSDNGIGLDDGQRLLST
jgi:hypothetical protein